MRPVAMECLMMERILAIDDDVALCELLSDYLVSEGFEVESAHDGETGLEMACGGTHDLIVLDVMLPGMNGFDVCRAIRRAGSTTPVIMLTAREEEADKVLGLDAGADGILTKEVSIYDIPSHIVRYLIPSESPG